MKSWLNDGLIVLGFFWTLTALYLLLSHFLLH